MREAERKKHKEIIEALMLGAWRSRACAIYMNPEIKECTSCVKVGSRDKKYKGTVTTTWGGYARAPVETKALEGKSPYFFSNRNAVRMKIERLAPIEEDKEVAEEVR